MPLQTGAQAMGGGRALSPLSAFRSPRTRRTHQCVLWDLHTNGVTEGSSMQSHPSRLRNDPPRDNLQQLPLRADRETLHGNEGLQMILNVAFFAAALMAQDQPAASAPATAQPAPATQAAPQRPRRICESRAPTGRRLEQRVCYTPEQYAAIAEAKRREAEEMVGRGIIQDDRRAEGGIPR